MKKNSRYARTFKTMIPEKTWGSKSIANLEKLANNLGDHCADWVEQALEWAQRIANGESWEDICNQIDNTNYFRLVVWKSGYLKFIGGSSKYDSYYPISHIGRDNYKDHIIISDAVPLVVSYDV